MAEGTGGISGLIFYGDIKTVGKAFRTVTDIQIQRSVGVGNGFSELISD